MIDGQRRPLRECVLEPGGCTAFCSHSNSNMLTHPAREQVPRQGLQGDGECGRALRPREWPGPAQRREWPGPCCLLCPLLLPSAAAGGKQPRSVGACVWRLCAAWWWSIDRDPETRRRQMRAFVLVCSSARGLGTSSAYGTTATSSSLWPARLRKHPPHNAPTLSHDCARLHRLQQQTHGRIGGDGRDRLALSATISNAVALWSLSDKGAGPPFMQAAAAHAGQALLLMYTGAACLGPVPPLPRPRRGLALRRQPRSGVGGGCPLCVFIAAALKLRCVALLVAAGCALRLPLPAGLPRPHHQRGYPSCVERKPPESTRYGPGELPLLHTVRGTEEMSCM